MVCKKISGRLCLLLAVLLLLCAWLPLGVAHAEEQSDPAIDTSWYKADGVFFSLEDRADFLGFLSLISQGVTFQNQSLHQTCSPSCKDIATFLYQLLQLFLQICAYRMHIL